ncbi:MAG: transposase [Actinomycetales bacterium]
MATGDNPGRLRSSAAFAALAGVSPIQASSGKKSGHRLNRGGDRQANAAIHRIVLVRISHKDPRTIDYIARRTAQGPLQARHHPLPEAIRRPRDLPSPPAPTAHHRDQHPPPAKASHWPAHESRR